MEMKVSIQISRKFQRQSSMARLGEYFSDLRVSGEDSSFYKEMQDRLNASRGDANFLSVARTDEGAESYLHIWADSQEKADAGEAKAMQLIIHVVTTRTVEVEISMV